MASILGGRSSASRAAPESAAGWSPSLGAGGQTCSDGGGPSPQRSGEQGADRFKSSGAYPERKTIPLVWSAGECQRRRRLAAGLARGMAVVDPVIVFRLSSIELSAVTG